MYGLKPVINSLDAHFYGMRYVLYKGQEWNIDWRVEEIEHDHEKTNATEAFLHDEKAFGSWNCLLTPQNMGHRN